MKNILITLLLTTLFAACQSEKPTTEAAEPTLAENRLELSDAQLQNANLGIGKAEMRNLKSTLKVNGTVDVPPQNLVSISFPLGGFLKSSDLLEGMPVRKGQTLAVLEDQSYIQLQHDYLTEMAKMELSQTELARQQELSKENINATKLLQQAQTEYRLQQINIKSLAEKLRLIGLNPDNITPDNITRTVSVLSPISGFVSKVNVNPGKYLAPTDVMFELVNPDDIHAALTVFEKDLPKIKVGQQTVVTVPNMPGRTFPAKIILIGRTLDEHRSVEVHCHFAHEDHALSPGMFLNALVETTETNALTVPDDAILRFENRFFVFSALDAHHFEMLEVKPGAMDGGFTQISPVENEELAGKDLVLKNAYTLLGKMKNTEEE